jgi:GTP-binding protein
VVLAANKVDEARQEADLADLYRLGLGEAVPVSAEHGRGAAELVEVLRARAPRTAGPAAAEPRPTAVRVAVVGRPNVGKSSLVNALVGAERVLVHEEPGTTRDAVDTTLVVDGRTYVLVDTAGIRRKGRVQEPLEKLAVVMALKSLERCQVALLVLDGAEGITAQDAHIAGYAHDAGRASVVVVNKWDLVPPRTVRRAEAVEQIRERLPFLDYAPVCFTSATRREGIAELFGSIDEVAAAARRRLPSADLTAAARAAVARRPIAIGGVPLTVQSAAQVGVEPLTFVLRVNRPREIHFSYERYLVNALRHALGIEGAPMRLVLRRAVGPRARAGRLRR